MQRYNEVLLLLWSSIVQSNEYGNAIEYDRIRLSLLYSFFVYNHCYSFDYRYREID